MLRATATQAEPRAADRFDLFDLPVNATVLMLPDREELLLGQDSRTIRISLTEGTLLSGPVMLEFRIPSSDPLMARSSALQRFAAFRISTAGTISAPRNGPTARRLLLLQTLDALASDSRHHAVAVALFGTEQVEASWNAASDYLRSRVRRLIRQARALADGGSARLFPTERCCPPRACRDRSAA